MVEKLKSRKLWAAVVSAAIVAFGTELGLAAEQTHWIAGLAAALILGLAVVDAAKAKAVRP
jgi:hypothetical protein